MRVLHNQPAKATRGQGKAGKTVGTGKKGADHLGTTRPAVTIRAICDRQGVDALKLASERFRVNDLEELTLREASSLIDELKGTSNKGRKAGAR
ncbi:MAG: hypothetical protein GY842_28045 [bacterium]|nr:hypothetical protein [bacterium]